MLKKLVRRSLVPLSAAAMLLALAPGTAAAEQGVDVSSWQHPGGQGINWFSVRGSGQQFAMVKATEGLYYVNPFFVQDSLGIRAAGLARGTYHYADVTADPVAQAAFYSTVVLGQNGPLDLPPVIDLEDARGQSAQHIIGWLHAYLDTVQALTGRQPMIYTGAWFWRTHMANTTEFSEYPLWIADYNGGDGPTLPLPGGWQDWAFWQYSDAGSVPGISGNVDVNHYSGAAGPFSRLSNSDALGSLGSLGSAASAGVAGILGNRAGS
ncbi:glycoside hydrolase family 25 protein [Tomitella gaofuii]|uniref:glycoside hydrolase family 25 protein n=1 Tax=Tomitella gaofuii TaxID=2760083 RepID=UPI0015F87F7F